MKKIISALFVILICTFSLAACNNKSSENLDSSSKSEKTQSLESSKINSQSESSVQNSLDFMSYSNTEGILSIERVEVSEELAEFCSSYEILYEVDDCEVLSYISIPNDCSEQNPYKVIVYNRGGNSNLGTVDGEETAGICKGLNRIVIASKYRGSNGCTGIDRFGGDDLHDVTKLIDYCESFEFVDMNDLCVAGVSRGGMMSYLTAKNDNRVKKVISISGATDLVSGAEQRDDMKKLLTERIGGTYEELPEEYEARSAVYWADKINVPVLIIHSKGDKQVAFSQAEDMVKQLKKYDKEYYFVTYDDDFHGVHQEDIQIMIKYLNGEDISEYVTEQNIKSEKQSASYT